MENKDGKPEKLTRRTLFGGLAALFSPSNVVQAALPSDGLSKPSPLTGGLEEWFENSRTLEAQTISDFVNWLAGSAIRRQLEELENTIVEVELHNTLLRSFTDNLHHLVGADDSALNWIANTDAVQEWLEKELSKTPYSSNTTAAGRRVLQQYFRLLSYAAQQYNNMRGTPTQELTPPPR